MARWRLTAAHYLTVPGTEWEYKETSRATGRQARKVYPVPLFLNPEDGADHNYPRDGVIIVAHEGPGALPNDIIFEGDPTPEMEPLDSDAEALSEARRPHWKHPIDSLPGNYTESLLSHLERLVSEAQNKQQTQTVPTTSTKGVDPDRLSRLEALVEQLAASNAELQAQLAEREATPPQPEPTLNERRA